MKLSEYIAFQVANGYPEEKAVCWYNRMPLDLTQVHHTDVLFGNFPVLEELIPPDRLGRLLHECLQHIHFARESVSNAIRHLCLWKNYCDPAMQMRIIDTLIDSIDNRMPPHRAVRTIASRVDLLHELYGSERAFVGRLGELILRYHAQLQVLAFTPLEKVPAWIDREALKKPLGNEIVESDVVHAIRSTHVYVGDCSEAEVHWRDVAVRGARKCVFHTSSTLPMALLAVKWVGDPSALALQTVRAPDGTYPLVRGGLYAIDKTDIARGYANGSEQFPFVPLSSFGARPLRFLGKPVADSYHIGPEEILEQLTIHGTKTVV